MTKYLLFLLFCINGFLISAQTDTRFWFVAPEVTSAHGDRPISIRLTTLTQAAVVTISQPANAGFGPITVNMTANQFQTVNLTPNINIVENKPANSILNYGILIESTAPINAYYEVQVANNPDIFSLKGRFALGTNFIIPTQKTFNNGGYNPEARNKFDIVATEDNTLVYITPSQAIVGHAQGVTFTILLNRGQTFSAVANGASAVQHLGGSTVSSTKKIAITVTDDSVARGACRDLMGDQIVPTAVLGTDYAIPIGPLGTGDHIYIYATESNTEIFVNGAATPVVTLNIGQWHTITNINTPNLFIKGSKPIYVLQVSGFGCEQGMALIPPIECTGSRNVTFNRTTNEAFFLLLIVSNGSQGNFLYNGTAGIINAASFTPVPGTGGNYLTASINLTGTAAVNAPINVSNTTGIFHAGIINGGASSGCRYGYFSNFGVLDLGEDLSKCLQDTVQLSAGYGYDTYLWKDGSNGVLYNAITDGPHWIAVTLGACTLRDTVFISHFPQIPVDLGIDTVICIGNNLILDAPFNSTYTYSWNTGNNSSSISVNTSGTYSVSVTDTNNCSYFDTLNLTVSPDINLNIATPTTYVCSNDTLTIIATGANNYIWQPATYLSSTNNDTIIAIPLSTTQYQVIGLDTYGCIDTVDFQLEVDIVPTVTMTGDTAICPYDSAAITLNITSTNSVDFTISNGMQNINIVGFTGNQYTFYTKNQGTYKVPFIKLSNSNVCSGSGTDSVVITHKVVPTVNVTGPGNLCRGFADTLVASGAVSYQWLSSPFLNNLNTDKPIANPDSTKRFFVIGTNAVGCVDTADFLLTVTPNINLNINLPITFLCFGDTVFINASGATQYQWYPSNYLSDSVGANIFAVPTQSTNYSVIGTDNNNCVDTIDFQLVTIPLPQSTITGNDTICPHDSTLVQFQFIGSAPFNFSYTINNQVFNVNNYNANQFQFYGQASGNYSLDFLEYTNQFGCSSFFQDTVKIVHRTLPNVMVSAAQSPLCVNEQTTLTAIGAQSISWLPSSSILQTTGNQVLINPQGDEFFSAVGTDAFGCRDTAEFFMAVNILPIPQLTFNQNPICSTQSTGAIAGGGVSYNWFPTQFIDSASNAAVNITLLDTTEIFVVVTDINGCSDTTSAIINVWPLPQIQFSVSNDSICPETSTSILVTGGVNYIWNNIPGLNTYSGNNVIATPDTNTSYQVVVTDGNGCVDSLQTTITIRINPTIVATSNDSAVCLRSQTQLNVTGAQFYEWQPGILVTDSTISNPLTTHLTTSTFIVKGTDAYGCFNRDTVQVLVNPLPVSFISATDSIICRFDSTILTANGANIYNWYDANNQLIGLGNSISVAPDSSTSYTIISNDINGCLDTASIQIFVNQLPQLQFSSNLPLNTVCTNDTILVNVSGANQYQWNNTPGILQLNSANVQIKPSVANYYPVIGTDLNGCASKDSIQILVYTLPNIILSTPDSSICITFSTPINASGAAQYTWKNTANLSNLNTPNVVANPDTTETFTVYGVDNNGCKDTADITITVNYQPTVFVTANDTIICIGDTMIISGNGAQNYQWTSLNNTFNGNTNNIVFTPNITDFFTMIGTDVNGCKDTATFQMFVNDLPTIQIISNGPNNFVCSGSTIQLQAFGAQQYVWDNHPTLQSTSGQSVNANPITQTIFGVTGTDGNGCINRDTILIKTWNLPNVSLNTDTAQVCPTFGTTLSANGAVSYNWSPTQFLNTTIGNSVIASPDISRNFIVIGTDANGCRDTAFAHVIVRPTPVLSFNPTNPVICRNQSINVTASGAQSYQWSGGAGTPSNLQTATLNPTTTTTYKLKGTNNFGCNDSVNVTVTVNQLPVLTFTPANPEVCIGQHKEIIVNGANNYVWNPSASIAYNGGDTIRVNPTVNSNYIVTGTDGNGCINTDTVNVIVRPLPIISISNPNPSVCSGSSFSISATGAAQYRWKNTFTNAILSQTPFLTTTPPSSITYRVIGTSLFGCVDSLNFNVTVNPLPTLNYIVNPTTICAGDSVTITAFGANSYSWGPSNIVNATSGNSIRAFPSFSRNVYFFGTNTNGCVNRDSVFINVNQLPNVSISAQKTNICRNDSTTLTALGAVSYVWGFSPNSFVLNPSAIRVFPQNATNYSVTGTDANGCKNSAAINIQVTPLPTITASQADTFICRGTSTTLSAIGGNSYIWSPSVGLNNPNSANVIASPQNTTTYIVRGFGANNCVNRDTVTVFIYPDLTVNAIGDATICAGDTVTISAIAGNGFGGQYTYQWQPASTAKEPNKASTAVYPSVTTTYVISTKDICNAAPAIDSVRIIVNPLPNIRFRAVDYEGCVPFNAQFFNQTANIASYFWDFDNGDTSSVSAPAYLFTKPGEYDVRLIATDFNGCKNTSPESRITVFDLPEPKFSMSKFKTDFREGIVDFDATASKFNIQRYYWDFGGLGNSTLVNPSFEFYKPGRFDIKLAVEDNNGCIDTAYNFIEIENIVKLYIPNTFTPNFDNKNNTWGPEGDLLGSDIKNYKLEVFNAWGQKIWQTEDPLEKWDGIQSAEEGLVQTRTYSYKLTFEAAGRWQTYQGVVHLIR